MGVFKRGDTYHVEFTFNGQRIRRSAQTTNKRRAEEYERKLRQELHDQHLLGRPVVRSMTLRQAIERYLREVVKPKGQKPKTAQADISLYDGLAERFGEDTRSGDSEGGTNHPRMPTSGAFHISATVITAVAFNCSTCAAILRHAR